MANLFRGFKALKKVWLTFLQEKLKKKMYRVPFVRLKDSKMCTPDVFTGSTDLKKVTLIHLEVNMSEKWQKQQT